MLYSLHVPVVSICTVVLRDFCVKKPLWDLLRAIGASPPLHAMSPPPVALQGSVLPEDAALVAGTATLRSRGPTLLCDDKPDEWGQAEHQRGACDRVFLPFVMSCEPAPKAGGFHLRT